MDIISAREFRSNQTSFLTRAKKGERIVIKSRVGSFQLTPVEDKENLTERICRGLRQVKMIREGKLPRRSVEDLLNEL